MSYNDADIILLCFSIGDPESLGNVATKVCMNQQPICDSQGISFQDVLGLPAETHYMCFVKDYKFTSTHTHAHSADH